MKKETTKCRYCRKPLEEFDCSLIASKERGNGSLIFSIFIFIIFPLTWFLELVYDMNRDSKLEKKGKTTTCTNKDCIGYLDGCK